MGTLYLVATPIGNLEDLSSRAISILRKSVLIAAEDTRVTRKLLDHYGIETSIISYHAHNHLARVDKILQTLELGDVAVVSDAGTPGLNDPGALLVEAVLTKGFPVSPIPGASAPIAALVASGLPTDSFLYLGYLPRRRKDRIQFLQTIHNLPYTLIFLETPHRLMEALEDLKVILGDRMIACARELTKIHEEITRGKISEVYARFQDQDPRGEFTLIVSGALEIPTVLNEIQLEEEIRRGVQKGISASELSHVLVGLTGISRRELYRRILNVQAEINRDE
jgi:16S rRNA (cytidine1402-2'-O)-methyltransferase